MSPPPMCTLALLFTIDRVTIDEATLEQHSRESKRVQVAHPAYIPDPPARFRAH